MGIAKRMAEHHETLVGIATGIAIKAGSLEACVMHEDTVIDLGDPSMALELAEKLFKQCDESVEMFDSLKELLDAIGEAIESAGEECYQCARWRDD